MDDTTLKKTGRHIPGVSYSRDPMSPPFYPNLRRGQRFIQASAILRPEALNGPARAIPVRFQPAPPPAKPGKRATEQQLKAYRLAQKTQSLSCQGTALIHEIRTSIDQAGCAGRTLLLCVDGSYCNGNVLRNLPENTDVIARGRGDMSLFLPPAESTELKRGRRFKYGSELPKPTEIRTRDEFPWQQAGIFGAGRLHDVKYKVVSNMLWRYGARTRPLRLVIIAPLRYRPTRKSKLLYRDPAYLLSTDLTSPIEPLIQAYFDRWGIEVNHRDEKSLLGVGHAQVRSERSAPRVPQFQVALYAMLLMAALLAYGPRRTGAYLPSPKWRKKQERRPSTLDILALLREELLHEAVENPMPSTSTRTVRSGKYVRKQTVTRRQRVDNATRRQIPVDVLSAVLYAST